jgi:hypothetical protein
MNLKSIIGPVILLFLFPLLIFTANLSNQQGYPKKSSLNPRTQSLKTVETVKPDMNFGDFPLYFVINKGQVNQKASFYAKTSKYTLWVTNEGFIFDRTFRTHYGEKSQPRGFLNKRFDTETSTPLMYPYSKPMREVSKLTFINANKNPAVIPANASLHKVNYFIGNDRAQWYRDIPTSQAVLYKNLYRNVHLKVYGIERQIEYDWIVEPGGNPGDIRFEYENVKRTRIDEDGNLLIETEFGKLIHKRPKAYQVVETDSGFKDRKVINVIFKRITGNTYGFEVGKYDKKRQLIIDPVVLAYSTYFGGSLNDGGDSIAVDNSGNAYVTGITESIDFPTQNQYQLYNAGYDVFVAKIDTTASGAGSLVYSTYLGGDDDEEGYGIAVDNGGNAYVVGYTWSTDFPTLNQYQDDGDIGDSSADAFVTKLSSGGDSLLYSTYLGGSSNDQGYAIAPGSGGNVYITGFTNSTNFPTLNQYQDHGDINDSASDVFVARLDTTQIGADSLIYSTYLGGNDSEEGESITVDGSGNAYVVGYTDSTNFPTRNPYQTDTGDSSSDAFITKIDTNGVGDASLIYSTYLGGGSEDCGWDIAIDSSGSAYIAGATMSGDFPVVNAYQSNLQGVCDGFVIKLSAAGNSLLYSTYFGGSLGGWFLPFIGFEEGHSIAVDSSGNAYVTGITTSTDFPVVNAFQSGFQGGPSDAFVIKLSASGDSLIYSTYLGGNDEEEGYGIALDNLGVPYIIGDTYSTNFPTLNAFASSALGDCDFFVTKLIEPPTVTTLPVSNITLSSAQCGGNVASNGGAAVTDRGVCWSVSPNPTISDDLTDDGTGTGTFTSNITGLTSATTYYVRAYATNSFGCTGYGDEEVFSTDVTVSGTVTDGVNPLQNVTITFSHDNHIEYTDAGGNYSYTIPFGTTTTIIPGHTAVSSWSPTFIYLDDVSANMSSQDFQALVMASNTIAGVVSSGGTGLGNVTMTGLPGNPTTDASGSYSAVVLRGWSGTVTPDLAGYIFTPQYISYSNVNSDQVNQNYTALSGNPVISGSVRTPDGTGVSGVELTFSNGGGGAATGTNGNYTRTVVSGWSGTVTPSLSGYSFSPVSISYSNVISNQANQNYTAVFSENPVISGIIWTLSGNRLQGVQLKFSNGGGEATSNYKGNYSREVVTGWSGMVTPSKEGYEFVPVSRSYTNVSSSQANNDFVSMVITEEVPEILINRNQLYYGADKSGSCTGDQSILVSNSGGGTLNWTASTDQGWLKCTPSSGTEAGVISVSVSTDSLAVGTYTGVLTISAANAVNSPQTVDVTLNVYKSTKEPFGVFSTPIDDSTVCSSIPVTGWVLDDIEVKSVKIYREAGSQLAYIGDAVFVEGARPDVELTYPGYPMNYRAGWGLMILTNFLPNNGNGTFTLHAVATDSEGNNVTLGTKTIIVDNANAVKPFGAIDLPAQGGIAAGGEYANWGWVLTPQPNTIPRDGSTIYVYIDGVNLGNPNYNIYREDVASLLPGYNNSEGAAGKFVLDTTQYENGVHTIQWIAADDAGNKDGIGSRYFSIQNTGAGATRSERESQWLGSPLDILLRFPDESTGAFTAVKRNGYKIESTELFADNNGKNVYESKELELVEIRVGKPSTKISGFMIKGNSIGVLPVGSTLNDGVFYWSPGPGYCGQYNFLFMIEENGNFYKKGLTINIKPLVSGKQ